LSQEAVELLNKLAATSIVLGNTVNVTNEDHRFLMLDQLREIESIKTTLLLEPTVRNATPAMTMAALYASEGSPNKTHDPILVITPADQIIQYTDAFTKAFQSRISLVADDGSKKPSSF
jgi:mannose-1-phosphate guanylyltransferase/mannose-6-phosphate isomerase